jgi:hypothetical protein
MSAHLVDGHDIGVAELGNGARFSQKASDFLLI